MEEDDHAETRKDFQSVTVASFSRHEQLQANSAAAVCANLVRVIDK